MSKKFWFIISTIMLLFIFFIIYINLRFSNSINQARQQNSPFILFRWGEGFYNQVYPNPNPEKFSLSAGTCSFKGIWLPYFDFKYVSKQDCKDF